MADYIIFFSVIGLLLYLWTCRPPHIGRLSGEEAQRIHHEYVSSTFKKAMGSVVHCVGGDGLGTVTAMVIARLNDFSFWQEFALQCAVGFASGWFIFQFRATRNMGNSIPTALLKAGRAEFFSMFTVMVGTGLVMRFITSAVVGTSPKPDAAAFWGFASPGLMVSAMFTYPMNWWLVSLGWKHGMS